LVTSGQIGHLTLIYNAMCICFDVIVKKQIKYFMAKQKGIIKLKGEVGDLSFYRTRDGYIAREKTEISKERIKKDPKFAPTRANMAEFERGNKGSKLLRKSLSPVTTGISDGRMISRLNKEMAKVLRSDAINDPGKRNFTDADLMLLRGFEFNKVKSLEHVLGTRIVTAFSRTTGQATVTLDSFIPQKLISAPVDATHYTLSMGVSACNFEADDFHSVQFHSALLELGSESVTLPPLSANIGAGMADPVFVVLNIEFSRLGINGKYYRIRGAYHAAAIMLVDVPES
jgi:hypothetical protein